MYNRTQFVGYVGKDPEIRMTQSNVKIASFSLATTETGKDKQKTTTWSKHIAFNKKADVIEKYIKKGSKVFICGKYDVSSYKDKQGQTRYDHKFVVSEIIMLDNKEDSPNTPHDQSMYMQQQTDLKLNDQIPF